MPANLTQPMIVAIGGTAKTPSSTDVAVRLAAEAAERMGATVKLFGGDTLAQLPIYLTPESATSEIARTFVEAVRQADGLIVASPGYHGSISGLVKNALDYLEETARDTRVYLEGVPVGLITTAYGWQATGSTLAALRSIVHALRGWPTPFGAAINSIDKPFRDGACHDAGVSAQLELVARQVHDFAQLRKNDPRFGDQAGVIASEGMGDNHSS